MSDPELLGVVGGYSTALMQSVYYTVPADWVILC